MCIIRFSNAYIPSWVWYGKKKPEHVRKFVLFGQFPPKPNCSKFGFGWECQCSGSLKFFFAGFLTPKQTNYNFSFSFYVHHQIFKCICMYLVESLIWRKKTEHVRKFVFFFGSSKFGFGGNVKYQCSESSKFDKKSIWVFTFQKYSKFWSVSLDNFIKHKPLIS